MSPKPDIARQTYRSRATAIYLGVIGLLGSTFTWMVGVAIMRPGVDILAILMLVAGAGGYVLTFRAARAGIRVEEDGVVIMNVMRTATIPWVRLRGFSMGAHGAWPRVGIAHLNDGSTVAIWGIQGPNPWVWSRPGRAERMIDQLNQLLEGASSAPCERTVLSGGSTAP